MKTLECKQVYLALPPVLTEGDVVSLDLELSGLREEQLHRPAGRFVSLAASFDGETAYLIRDEDDVQQFLDNISKATWVYHNSTFDIGHLRRWAKVEERYIRDTMLIEKLMWADYYDDFGLNDLVRRYLGCYMEKSVRSEFHELEGEMTQEQIHYAALDVIGTWLVDKEQQKIIEKQDKLVWDKIDMPTVWTSVGLSGFMLDTKKWLEMANTNVAKKEAIEQELGQRHGTKVIKTKHSRRMPLPPKTRYDEEGDEIYPSPEAEARYQTRLEEWEASKYTEEEFVPFNPASPSQVLKLLQSQGVDIQATGDEFLSPLRDENELVAKLLDYRVAAKKASTYGADYLKFVEEDGRIYSSLNVIGAATGRMSSRSPNLQQIPRDAEYRKCFIAGEGKKLVIADYSSQEPRIFAYLTQDPQLIEIFNSGKDIYCEVARFAFGENITKADKERRNQVKSLVLGLMYGLSPYGFAAQNEVDIETAQEDFDRFFAAFPEAAEWVKTKQAYNPGFTRTILGRKCHLHPYNPQWKRNSLNNPIQGGGSDMLKIAMRGFRKDLKDYIETNQLGIVLPVHDEIIVWCNEDIAEMVKGKLEFHMIAVAEKIHKGIPANVEAHICDDWSGK